MNSSKLIHIISCHAEGEVGNVIVGGIAAPKGDSLWQKARWIDQDQKLRQFVLNEPRGGGFKHVNLLVPAQNPKAQQGFIVMEPEHTPPMSGSNSICVSTVLLDTGLIEMKEPITEFILEAPGGLVPVKAYCEDGKAKSIEINNVASFADQLGVFVEVEGFGTLKVDTAYGGDSFVIREPSSGSASTALSSESATIANSATNQSLFTVPNLSTRGAIIDYVIYNSGETRKRVGTLAAVWNTQDATVNPAFSDSVLVQLGTSTTSEFTFTVVYIDDAGLFHIRASNSVGETMYFRASVKLLLNAS